MGQQERVEGPPASLGTLFAFWSPLASTWLMMSLEGPFLAAVIARLVEPTINLAAYGVAFAIALIVESPVIMMLTAATALVEDDASFRRLRGFTFALSGAVTAVLALLLIPPVFDLWALGAMRLPAEVAGLTWTGLLLLLPWPGAIGYRRFYQGIMIRSGKTRRVAFGTLVRLVTMTATAACGAWVWELPGAWAAAVALSTGVTAEAITSRWMAGPSLATVRGQEGPRHELGYGQIVRFYTPLAATSFIGLATQPLTTFFMGQARASLESLAILPVVLSLTFVFRSPGLAFQEVGITFLARDSRNLGGVTRMAGILAVGASLGLAVLAFTPASTLWLERLSGLSPELAAFALPPMRILAVIPALSVLLSLQRTLIVHGRATSPVTAAMGLELGTLGIVLFVSIRGFDMVGAVAAALGLLLGRVAGNAYLVAPCLAVVRRIRSGIARVEAEADEGIGPRGRNGGGAAGLGSRVEQGPA